MARLNTHLSATPQPQTGRSSTVDSLYRDPTPLPRASSVTRSAARESMYSTMSPARSFGSDKENDVPRSRDNTPKPVSKGKRPMAPPVHPPTPPSDSTSSRHGNKRRRTDEHSIPDSVWVYEDEDEEVQLGDDVDEEDVAVQADDEDATTKYYDPQQDPDIRRQLRANMRNHQREIEDNRDELTKPGNNQLLDHLKRQDYYMGKVKQTADAALDSRVMVLASDLASKKLNNTLHGNSDVGVDVDQFVSRVIHFMKSGGRPDEEELAPNAGDDEEEDVGDGLDWALLGSEACFPCNKRPPVTSFLLGPLSVEKRVRVTQRRARSQRQPTGPATRPQELTQDDIQQSENTNLTHLVKAIKARLEEHINKGMEGVNEELGAMENEPEDEDMFAATKRHRIEQTPDGEGAVSLFEFIINPLSFGQTVENLFYVSFLIREGNVQMIDDENGLPLLVPAKPFTIEEHREQNVQKHQAVFSLDWGTWKKLIQAFSIQEPIIPHRVAEETNVSAGGWYG